MQSLEKMKKLEAGVIYPGHGSVIADGNAAIVEYINHRNNREKQVLQAFFYKDDLENYFH